MDTTWILIASGERARCFERHISNHSLSELTDFVQPHASPASDFGKGHGRTGHAGTQFEPHTEARKKSHKDFARHLADYLNDAVGAKRCSSLVLIATNPMLGEIKPLLSLAASKALKRAVSSDLTHLAGPELKNRVDHALALPAQ